MAVNQPGDDFMFRIFTWLADRVTYSIAGLDPESRWSGVLHFFIEDITKIFALVTVMIFVIAVLRAGLDSGRIRDYLSGRRRFAGYVMASAFGVVTPFCSCSSIPLFLGFTSARIPLGITMAFLITSPMINEVAIILMGGMLGWKFLAVYVTIGMAAGILGGAFLDRIGAEQYLMPVGRSVMEKAQRDVGAPDGPEGPAETGAACCSDSAESGGAETAAIRPNISFRDRLFFAAGETGAILKRIWIWVFVGVGAGAFIHGLVPESFIADNLGAGQWWSVPLAVLLGIPMYGGASATVPVIGSLISKGLPVGTATVFMMSVVAVSFPEFVMLKQVMKSRLLLIFFAMLLVFFTVAGWTLNQVM